MNKRLLGAILMVLGGLALMGGGVWYYLANRQTGPYLPVVGTRLPAFQLADLNGRAVGYNSYAGKPLIINFWATWCPPCRDEMPMLVDYYNKNQANGVVILSINAGETAVDAANFVNAYQMKFPVLLDADSKYFDSLLLDSLPTTILVGPDGVVRALHIGYMSPEVFQNNILAKIGR